MRIYLAGKISNNDWRTSILGSRPGGMPETEISQRWPILERAIFGEHDYVGPYFISCDHGCAHRPSEHAAIGGDCNGEGPDYIRPAWVVSECLRAIDRADLVFAWIDDASAYGTIAEIGYAIGRSKPVCLAYAPWFRSEHQADLWFVESLAALMRSGDGEDLRATESSYTPKVALTLAIGRVQDGRGEPLGEIRRKLALATEIPKQ